MNKYSKNKRQVYTDDSVWSLFSEIANKFFEGNKSLAFRKMIKDYYKVWVKK